IALYESVPSLSGEETFFISCTLAALSGLAGNADAGVSVGEGKAAADRAMIVLRRAVAMGYRNVEVYCKESSLDPLRSRPDFQLLMMDLAMPAEPFAAAARQSVNQ